MRGSIRRFLTLALVVAAISAYLFTQQPRHDTVHAEGTRPNVVGILCGDATYREIRLLPQAQWLLAAHGTTFPNYYDSTSVCCPARAGIMSGQYNHNNKVQRNSDTRKFSHNNGLGKWMDDAGYQTALLGKYMNGYSCAKPIPAGW